MARKNDNKRVLRSGNGRNKASNRKVRRRRKNNFNARPAMPVSQNPRRAKKKRKTSGFVVLIMIIALAAFVIGAGIGVSLSFDDGNDEGPHFENVTREMTTGLNNTSQVIYDKEVDSIDFNENMTSQLSNNYSNVNN